MLCGSWDGSWDGSRDGRGIIGGCRKPSKSVPKDTGSCESEFLREAQHERDSRGRVGKAAANWNGQLEGRGGTMGRRWMLDMLHVTGKALKKGTVGWEPK
jgi:hypothetical protein